MTNRANDQRPMTKPPTAVRRFGRPQGAPSGAKARGASLSQMTRLRVSLRSLATPWQALSLAGRGENIDRVFTSGD